MAMENAHGQPQDRCWDFLEGCSPGIGMQGRYFTDFHDFLDFGKRFRRERRLNSHPKEQPGQRSLLSNPSHQNVALYDYFLHFL